METLFALVGLFLGWLLFASATSTRDPPRGFPDTPEGLQAAIRLLSWRGGPESAYETALETREWQPECYGDTYLAAVSRIKRDPTYREFLKRREMA